MNRLESLTRMLTLVTALRLALIWVRLCTLSAKTPAPALRLKRIVFCLLLVGLGLGLATPSNVPAQYPPLPVPPGYQGPSREPGQIMLDGTVRKISLQHGRLADEDDWHVYIDLDAKATQDLRSYLWTRNYALISSDDCLKKANCNLDKIYCEVMVLDKYVKPTLGDDKFYSADFTLPLLLSQPPPEKRPGLHLPDGTVLGASEWTGEHPAWDFGLIAMANQGELLEEAREMDFSDYSQLVSGGGRAYLQGAFVEDATHRACKPTPTPTSCQAAPIKYAKTIVIEIHPLDSIAFSMDETGKTLSAKRGQALWPTKSVRWRVAFLANSKLHKINSEPYLKKERTTTWYLDLPNDAYNSWGDPYTTVNVETQPQQLWGGGKKVWYAGRGWKVFEPAILAVDPKDNRKKLKISATMNVPDNWGGIIVCDYIIRVTLHSNPDLGIRVSNSNYADASFSLGAGVRQNVPRNTTAVYYVRGHNQGPVPIQFRFKGVPGSSGWNVRYFDALTGGNNITSQVTGSGWLSPLIQGGGSTQEIRVEVTPSPALANGAEKLVRVWAESSVEPGRKDIVEAVTKVGQPEPPIN